MRLSSTMGELSGELLAQSITWQFSKRTNPRSAGLETEMPARLLSWKVQPTNSMVPPTEPLSVASVTIRAALPPSPSDRQFSKRTETGSDVASMGLRYIV